MRYIIVFIVLIGFNSATNAQMGCYEPIRSDALRYMNQGRYADALTQFWLCLTTCKDIPEENDLIKQIQKAQSTWVNTLEDAIAREKSLKKSLEEANTTLVALNKELETAKNAAQQNALIATQMGRKAESLRLVMLSRQLREKGRAKDAQVLAALAISLAGKEVSSDMVKAWGESSREIMQKQTFPTDAPFTGWTQTPGNTILIEKSNHSFWLMPTEGSPRQIIGPSSEKGVLEVADDGLHFLYYSGNKAKIIDDKGTEVALNGHTGAIRFGAFSPDNQLLVTCARDGSARVWRTADGSLQFVAREPDSSRIYEVLWLNNTSFLARSGDGFVYKWSLDQEAPVTVSAGSIYVYDICLIQSTHIAAIASADGTLRMWTGNSSVADIIPLSKAPLLKVSPVGKEALAILDGNGDLILYHIATRRQETVSEQISGFFADEHSGRLLAWDDRNNLRIWADTQGKEQLFSGHTGKVVSACLSGDGSRLFSTSTDGTARLWSSNGDVLLEWPLQSIQPLAAGFTGNDQKIIVFEKDNRSVSIVPRPDLTLDEIPTLLQQEKQRVSLLKQEFELLFAGE